MGKLAGQGNTTMTREVKHDAEKNKQTREKSKKERDEWGKRVTGNVESAHAESGRRQAMTIDKIRVKRQWRPLCRCNGAHGW